MTQETKLIFDFNWKLTLCVIFVFPALLRLSFWQIERAQEKKAIANAWKLQQQALPEEYNESRALEQQRIFAQGRYLPEKYWLRENQFYSGQLGYNVIMPFQTESGPVLAVDRGWVKGSPVRDYVPVIPTSANSLRISGVLVTPSDSKLIQEEVVEVEKWPHKILEVDLPLLSEQSDLSLSTKLLRIDADSPGALVIQWRPINISPAKHYAYAVQWALMSIALVVLYVFASTNMADFIKARKRR